LIKPIHDFIGQCELRPKDGPELNLVECLLLVVPTLHHLSLKLLPELSLYESESFILRGKGLVVPQVPEEMQVLLDLRPEYVSLFEILQLCLYCLVITRLEVRVGPWFVRNIITWLF
jgi:hypothetical protein